MSRKKHAVAADRQQAESVDRAMPIRLGPGFAVLAPGLDPVPVEVVLNLLRACAQIDAVFAPIFEASRLTPTGYGVLEVLVNSTVPLTPTVISRQMLVSPKTLSHQLNVLEHRGLLNRSPHQSDRRSVLVELTKLGRETVLEVTSALIPIDIALLAPVPRVDQQRLVELLGAVQEACRAML